jgi:hypothetical protein
MAKFRRRNLQASVTPALKLRIAVEVAKSVPPDDSRSTSSGGVEISAIPYKTLAIYNGLWCL